MATRILKIIMIEEGTFVQQRMYMYKSDF